MFIQRKINLNLRFLGWISRGRPGGPLLRVQENNMFCADVLDPKTRRGDPEKLYAGKFRVDFSLSRCPCRCAIHYVREKKKQGDGKLSGGENVPYTVLEPPPNL